MTDFNLLADKVLAGDLPDRTSLRAILDASDKELPALLDATSRIREAHFGKKVMMHRLVNARSGFCGEDCGYCSQGKTSTAPINKYPMMSEDKLIAGAKDASEKGATRYCIATAGTRLGTRDHRKLCDVVKKIKAEYPVNICCSVGELTQKEAEELYASGVTWVNHNLNTSKSYYDKICSTHTYEDRVEMGKTIKKAGLNLCSGGIIGMGESLEDRIDLALACREADATAIPVNFFHPIEGAPLGAYKGPSKSECLKALCMFRFVNPDKEIRVAGGREFNLGEDQNDILKAANAIFMEGYLTTGGQDARSTVEMIESAGYELTQGSI